MNKRNLDEKIAALYYTAAEARTVLGMSKDSFNYWVKIGKIQKRELLGKHGFYAKRDIDALAARLEAMMLADMPGTLTFRRATIEDLDAETYLAYQVFGQRANSPELRIARRAYLETNPDSFWHLYDQEKLVSFINIVPLKHEAMQQFRQGKRGWTFPLSEIEQFTSDHPIECIIIDFVTTPTVPPDRRERYAMQLLIDLAEVLKDWGSMGIEITHICAASATESGQRILRTAGFQVIGDSGHGRLLYELVLSTSNIKMLRHYKQALAEWKQEQVQEPPTS